ncbi:MAG: hypothetical protein JO279_03660 [Verrucomicrobia bacterium]|nr:hypothetical protein [Verrucomicrobiota bacterium]
MIHEADDLDVCRSGLSILSDGTAELTEYYVPPAQMLAILDSADLVDRYPEAFHGSVVAACNSPKNFVIATSIDTRLQVQEFLKARGILFAELPVDYPFHSPQIDVLRSTLQAIFDRVAFASPAIPIITAEGGGFLNQPVGETFVGRSAQSSGFCQNNWPARRFRALSVCGSRPFRQHGDGR